MKNFWHALREPKEGRVTTLGDTSELLFFLYAPEDRMSRFTEPGKAFGEETAQSLIFDNKHLTKVRVGKGIGDIILHREIPNWKTGDEFATEWETCNVAEDGYDGLRFSILTRTPEDDARMLAWNKEHPEELYTDCLAIDHGTEVHVCLYLASDKFHHLLNLNWQEKYIEVSLDTSPSIHNLRFPLQKDDKYKMRDGTFYDTVGAPLTHRRLVIHRYEITVKDLPVPPLQQGRIYSLFNFIYRLFGFFSSR